MELSIHISIIEDKGLGWLMSKQLTLLDEKSTPAVLWIDAVKYG